MSIALSPLLASLHHSTQPISLWPLQQMLCIDSQIRISHKDTWCVYSTRHDLGQQIAYTATNIKNSSSLFQGMYLSECLQKSFRLY